MEELNLHCTGDFHAITSAHNLLAALIDNHLHFENPLGIDPATIFLGRVLDLNDRALRQVPLLEVALQTDAAYIGAMGSRRTHDDRLARLREEGVTEKALARLASPIGLDIGARTPEETAVSIAAEIVVPGAKIETPSSRISPS